MKTFKIILAGIILFLLFFSGCMLNISVGTVESKPVTPDLVNLIAVSAIGLYEIIVRIVPTVADYSAVSWLIRILKLVS
ncbi:MAG TPA: hypothetical protein VGK38_01690, partial [Prolixibacteraceae bacterium]